MKSSFHVGTYFGIGVYVHFTFFFLLAFYGWIDYSKTGSIQEAIITTSFLVSLFTCVVLHEFGHALMAKVFKIKTQNITMYPFGGIARLEKLPEKPWQEFLVAIAGPAVNVIIIAIIFSLLIFGYSYPVVIENATGLWLTDQRNYLFNIALANAFLVIFNMLPAFPMDGGRVLRSLLAMVMPFDKATNIAGKIGKGMAILFALNGLGLQVIPILPTSPLLLVIALFVWMGATGEQKIASLKARAKSYSVGNFMVTNFFTLSTDTPLRTLVELVQKSSQTNFPVAKNGEVIGMVYREHLASVSKDDLSFVLVRDIMSREFLLLDRNEPITNVLNQIFSQPYNAFPVINNGLLVGLLLKERLLTHRIINPTTAS